MRRLPLLFSAALIAAACTAPSLVAQASKADVVAYRVGTLIRAGGASETNVTIVVRDGVIRAVGADVAVPAGAREVDWRNRVVMPGLVNPLAYASTSMRASDESIDPEVRVLDGLDLYAKNPSLLRGGVTALYVSPNPWRLVSGVGAVVRTGGDADARVVRDVAALRVNLGPEAWDPPARFDPPRRPSARDPLKPATRQRPTTRLGAIAALRTLLSDAQDYARDRAAGAAIDPRLEALLPVLERKLPVRVHARLAVDVLQALDLKRTFGIDIVLEGATEAYRLAPAIAAAKVPVVVDVHAFVGRADGSDHTRDLRAGERDLRNAARLHAAGVRVALCLPFGENPAHLLLGAGYAARFGLPREAALAAITSTAADICGVADRVGSIGPGRHADFVVLDRDPFDARAEPLEVFVGGESVYRRPADRKPAEILAIRAARVMTMAGRTLGNATVLIEDGRITDVGEGLAIPSTARVYDLPGSIVTPGFIDCQSSIGVHRDRLATTGSSPTGFPRPGRSAKAVKFGENLVDAIEVGDEAFDAVLRAGVTSAILAPAGDINAQMAAVKLGARERDGFVLRRVAGVRYKMTLSDGASRAAAAKSLDSQLKKAKAYVAKREKYERDLAAYEKALAAAPASDKASDKSDAKSEKKDGIASLAAPPADEKKSDKSTAKKAPKKPTEPKRDDALEPWAAVLAGEARLVVILDREDTIEAALGVLTTYGVKPVLQGAREAHRVVDAVKRGAAGLVVTPPYEFRDRTLGLVSSARAISDARLPVGFYTGRTSGAQFLPLHAALAVRRGMAKAAALRGLTVDAAKLFHIDDRVGTIEVGKDGDLVVFSGDPFDVASRIELVVADGRVVFDARDGGKR